MLNLPSLSSTCQTTEEEFVAVKLVEAIKKAQ